MPDDGHISPLFALSQRLPPSNVQAEQAFLGALLHNNRVLDRCDSLEPEHFSDPLNGWIFDECRRRVRAGRVVDAVALADMANAPQWTAHGSAPEYLSHLLAAMVGIANATEYARVIRDTAIRRALIDVGESLVNAAFGEHDDVSQVALETIAAIDRATSSTPGSANFTTLDAAMAAAMASMDRAKAGHTGGVSSGFRCIDIRLGGLEPGLVYVLAGRPGMGKSSLGHQIAIAAARGGVPVLEMSLEMSAQQLGRRTLATAASVPIMAMKSGRLNTDDAGRVVVAQKELAGLPLTIDDAGGQTASQIAAKVRAARRKHGLGLIMVDHLNLVRADDSDARHGGTLVVERASATMLQLAKDCGCPLLLLAQLNRSVEGREDKRPTLSDLRQAGAIEQDAYAVGFVYRPEYYLGGEPEPRAGESKPKHDQRSQEWRDQKEALHGKAELIWAKVRDGEPGTDTLTFHGPTATFGEDV